MNQKQLKDAYKNTFATKEGRMVLEDLIRISNQSRIDQDAPNPYSCVYKIAQQALIKRVTNMLEIPESNFQHNLLEGINNDRRN